VNINILLAGLVCEIAKYNQAENLKLRRDTIYVDWGRNGTVQLSPSKDTETFSYTQALFYHSLNKFCQRSPVVSKVSLP